MTARAEFPVWGTTAVLVVTDPTRLRTATALLRAHLAEVDLACSRFRSDSEVSRLHTTPGRSVAVSPLLAEALGVALRAARLTGGLVDPTVGTALRAHGYDRDFAAVAADDPRPIGVRRVPGWHRLHLDEGRREVLLPRGVHLDLGATAKALAADRAAAAVAARTGCGVLVALGGDLATAGRAPVGGWQVAVGDDHRTAARAPRSRIALGGGAVATSSTTRRAWRRAGRPVHHVIDPRTGRSADVVWCTASVVAQSCVDANTAATAAIVLGADAPAWLADRGLPALLVAGDGTALPVGGWPAAESVVA
ncbi:FAD:protein FMN transferase [Actinokineospora spheciospongiae]|uniref:FAD:protein FMN transferase n=1 Tax=Actinokineospora spheciospongiae TaxID=909613 RepID=UPI000D719F93|nr:FAD:protein FMN transferase [Actinokineospora spheciospongiae]PWW62658.1 thiamine biosynthesis lipoprotein [Actinokineospora spheciospongiae]